VVNTVKLTRIKKYKSLIAYLLWSQLELSLMLV